MKILVPFCAVALLLTGCTLPNKSFLTESPIEISEEEIVHEFQATRVGRGELNTIVDDLKRRGTENATVTIHYAPGKSLKESAQIAEIQGQRIRNHLIARGACKSVVVSTLPDADAAPNRITISYRALTASAPAHCADISEADGDNFTHADDSKYRYGCQSKKMISAQIARPSDLLGNDAAADADSARLGKSQATYRLGERATNPGDEGLTASDVYQ
jgi:type IV pilus biogenesis protein CpaD/CtpE